MSKAEVELIKRIGGGGGGGGGVVAVWALYVQGRPASGRCAGEPMGPLTSQRRGLARWIGLSGLMTFLD